MRREIDGCTVSVSLPDEELPAPRWSDCDHIENCRVLHFPDAPDDDIQVFGGHTAAGPVIAEARIRDRRTTLTLRPLDGSSFLAATIDGTHAPCGVSPVFADDSASFAVSNADPARPHDRLFFVGPLREDPTWLTPVGRALFTDVSGPHALMGRSIALFDAHARLLRPGADDASPLLADPQVQDIDWLVGAGDVLLFGAREPRGSIWLLRPDHPPRRLLQTQEGEELGALVVDGDRLHWTVGRRIPDETHSRYETSELWTAPLPLDGGPPAARRVLDLGKLTGGTRPPDSLYASAGKVAYSFHPGKSSHDMVRVVDVDSGSYVLLRHTPLPGVMGSVVLMTPEEVVVTLRAPSGQRILGLVRLRNDRSTSWTAG